MYSPYFKKLFAATLQTLPIPVHAAQTETHTHTHMHVHEGLSLTHACLPHPTPVSLTAGGTLSRQASVPCQRVFANRAPPSSHGLAPQTDDSYTLGYDPAGTYTHSQNPTQLSPLWLVSFHHQWHVLPGFTFPSQTAPWSRSPLRQPSGAQCQLDRSTPSPSMWGIQWACV